MKIIGFVGVSGSGKSYRALEIAASCGLKHIIDDGLFISESRVLAGKSAKKERTRLASVRCALFFDKDLSAEVKKAIDEENPPGILILGTSHEMIKRISQTLSLPEIERYIEISDIASAEEIQKAQAVRKSQGKHVIPVPTFEIKKDFSGYWLNTLKRFTHGGKNEVQREERSVVRPTFSYMGGFEIANSVLVQICMHEAGQVDGVFEVTSCTVREEDGGIRVKLDIIARHRFKLQGVGNEIIKRVSSAVDKNTSINVNHVLVKFKSLEIKTERLWKR